MLRPKSWIPGVLVAASAGLSMPARCDDSDALALQSEPAAESTADVPLHLAFEFSVGRIDLRTDPSRQSAHRASIDLRYSTRLSESWRVSISDRLDDTHPTNDAQRSTVNSLREAYLGWQRPGESMLVDLGRVNLRQGPAFGYNPTDYFRTNALRTFTTADPVTLREMRMGTVMLRLGELWTDGGASVALAPKLADGPDPRPWAVDTGATNAQDSVLLTVNGKISPWLGGQASLFYQRDTGPRVGASMTALATDALVAYGEWSAGKVPSILDQVTGSPASPIQAQQAALGLTYTLPTATALTLEAEYNGAGLDQAGWNTMLNLGAPAYQRYLAVTLPSQELGTRRGLLFYASQKGLGLKQLDFTGFVRSNPADRSNLVWAELRHHWRQMDAAVQWQRTLGDARTEFGALPYRQIIQLVGVFYL